MSLFCWFVRLQLLFHFSFSSIMLTLIIFLYNFNKQTVTPNNLNGYIVIQSTFLYFFIRIQNNHIYGNFLCMCLVDHISGIFYVEILSFKSTDNHMIRFSLTCQRDFFVLSTRKNQSQIFDLKLLYY